MGRPFKQTTPPWIDLKESLELVRQIYDRGGGSVSYDELAQIMDSTIKSSSFRMKTVALRAFGLIQSDGKNIRLTNLGQMVVAPASQDEYGEALFKAFNNMQLHAELYQRYKGGYLPEDSFLGNTIVREFNAPADTKEQWIKCFKRSGIASGILVEEGGKIRVLQTPKPQSEPLMTPKPPMSPKIGAGWDTPLPLRTLPPPKLGDSFEVVLDDERSVTVPKAFDREDLEYLQGVLDLYVKRREAKK
jgi:hypothetical protein